MSEWVESSLNQLVTFQKGRKVETSTYAKPGYDNYLGASGIEGGADGYAATRFAVTAKPTDLLMLWDGERSGLVGYGRQGVVASTVSKLTPNQAIISGYLYYALSRSFDWIQNRRTGTGVPHVPKDLGRILRLSFPKNLHEQQRIAAILTSIDTAIEKTEALIEKYRQIKAGLMHDLFTCGVLPNGQLRPPREQSPELYQETAIGWFPREWSVVPLRKLVGAANIVNGPFGSDLLTSELRAEGVPVLYVQDVKAGVFSRVSNAHVTKAKANELAFCNVKRDDVLVAKVGAPPCDSCVYPFDEMAVVTQDVIRVRPGADVNAEYMSSLLNSPYGRKAVKRISIEGTRERVSLTEFKGLSFPVAESHEQSLIGARLEKAQASIAAEGVKLEKLRLQKHGLMQDLLTGKVPVKVGAGETANG